MQAFMQAFLYMCVYHLPIYWVFETESYSICHFSMTEELQTAVLEEQ